MVVSPPIGMLLHQLERDGSRKILVHANFLLPHARDARVHSRILESFPNVVVGAHGVGRLLHCSCD